MGYKKMDKKTINEFELVNNNEGKKGIFKVDIVRIEPILNKTKTGFEFILYDKNNNKVGMKDSEEKLTIFPEFAAKMKADGIDLNSKKLVLKGAKIPKPKNKSEEEKLQIKQKEVVGAEAEKQQEEKEKQDKKNIDNKLEVKNQNGKKKEKNNKDEEKIKSSSTRINHQDLINHPKYKNVTAWTTIMDNEFLDSVQGIKAHSPQLDKNSIVIAEIDNKFKILAKEMGTNRIIDLTPDARQVNNSAEKVNRIDGNKQSEGGRSYTFTLPVFDNKELAIRKTATGQIELERIENIDGKGNREAIKIGTDVTHPTKEESERAKYEKYGYDFKNNSGKAIMTDDEIEEEIEPLILENATKYKDKNEIDDIKTDVIEDINSSENPTHSNLEEIVNNNVEEYEKTEEVDEPEIGEEKEEKTLENDALERMEKRLFRKQ